MDGLWKADNKAGHRSEERTQLRRTGLIVYRVRVYVGHVYRQKEDGTWENESCPHGHIKRGAAIKCAEAATRRWNRIEQKKGRSYNESDR